MSPLKLSLQIASLLISGIGATGLLIAQENHPPAEPISRLPQLLAPSLGGVNLWSDELVCRGWRIQRHAYRDDCRLLDDQDYRRAWGTYEDCFARFQQLQQKHAIEPVTGKVVITLHGLARPKSVMDGLDTYLAEQAGYTPINFTYASTRQSLDDHAAALGKVVGNLDQATRIDFVCHSLGNMVVRRYLAMCEDDPSGTGIDPRFGRMVMLAPPNQGAKLAKQFRSNKLVGLLLGPSCKELGSDWETCSERFATPSFPFGIMCGTRSLNPLLHQTNDFLVTTEETKLPGACDFTSFPLLHGEMMNNPKCRECILRFLQEGYFVSEQEKQPIPLLPAQSSTPRQPVPSVSEPAP